jgi:hypothetical protein
MKQELIFIPIEVMVAITLIVWLWMFYLRLGEIFQNNIDPQTLDLKSHSDPVLTRSAAASDNLINLFELPVLFYVQALILYQLQLVDSFYLSMACLFVAFRFLHSLVHITYNNVNQRFTFYVLASLCLWTSWLFMGIDIVNLV